MLEADDGTAEAGGYAEWNFAMAYYSTNLATPTHAATKLPAVTEALPCAVAVVIVIDHHGR